MKKFYVIFALISLFVLTADSVRQSPQEAVAFLPDQFEVPVSITYYHSVFKLYESAFTQPFELCLFIFADGDILIGTNQFMDRIYFPTPISEFFIKQGKDIKNLAIVVHNHLSPASFSPDDKKFYHTLKRAGFTGRFAIYYPFSKRTIFYEEP